MLEAYVEQLPYPASKPSRPAHSPKHFPFFSHVKAPPHNAHDPSAAAPAALQWCAQKATASSLPEGSRLSHEVTSSPRVSHRPGAEGGVGGGGVSGGLGSAGGAGGGRGGKPEILDLQHTQWAR